MITGELKSQVDTVWNAFATGGISDPLTVIQQFTFLLFLRRLDESQLLEEKKAALIGQQLIAGEISNLAFQSQHQSLRWHTFKHNDPETMFELFTKPQTTADGLTVFTHMIQVGKVGGVFAKYMKGATFMVPTPRLLDQVVQMIDGIQMDDRDTKGDLYEYLLSKIAVAGRNGQFRTPRHIIKMMVEMMQPTQTDTMCDPACGTSGFLVASGEYVHEHFSEWFHDEKFREHYNADMFTGIEFDPNMLRIGAMNLQLHGIEHPQLIGRDALSESNAEMREQFSLILANPPFKGSLDYDAVESSLLKTVKTKKTELLFLALMLRMLKIGGRCAVIVPDGVLFGSSNAHKNLRQTLVKAQKLEAVISMPSGVFKPYAGVSTAILIFTKTSRGDAGGGGTDKVWFYDMQADGYSLDDKRQSLVGDLDDDVHGCTSVAGTGSAGATKRVNLEYHEKNNIPDIISRFKQRHTETERKRTEQSFLVPMAEIEANDWDLSINRYKEIVYEEVVYDAPAEIIKQIEELDGERAEALRVLKGLLAC